MKIRENFERCRSNGNGEFQDQVRTLLALSKGAETSTKIAGGQPQEIYQAIGLDSRLSISPKSTPRRIL